MAVTPIPPVTNWTVTPQNGQAGYFTLMNTWLGQSTSVIASLQAAITAQNTANSEINALAIQTENNATIANGLANFQGAWSSLVSYLKGQSVESTTGSKIYYISKVDNNLNHLVTDTSYWLVNPINNKIDKDISTYTDKATPVDADLIPLSDSAASFGIKKLSWLNIKATLKTYFDTLYTVASSETTKGIIEIATIAEAQAGTDDLRAITPLKLFNSLKGSKQSLLANGYQMFHGGLIIQWGSTTIGASGTVVTLPVAFPTNMVVVSCGISDSGLPSGTLYAYRSGSSLSQIVLDLNTTSTANATYIAIGY